VYSHVNRKEVRHYRIFTRLEIFVCIQFALIFSRCEKRKFSIGCCFHFQDRKFGQWQTLLLQLPVKTKNTDWRLLSTKFDYANSSHFSNNGINCSCTSEFISIVCSILLRANQRYADNVYGYRIIVRVMMP
jgi:hypothetical protein